PWKTPARPSWSSCATSPGCRSRRRRRPWASAGRPPTATGRTPRSGCTAPSPARRRQGRAEGFSFSLRRGRPLSRTVLVGRLSQGTSAMEPRSIDRIFWDAAQMEPTGEREAYLDRACAGDAELRQKVELLLRARPKAENFLESPPADIAAVAAPSAF